VSRLYILEQTFFFPDGNNKGKNRDRRTPRLARFLLEAQASLKPANPSLVTALVAATDHGPVAKSFEFMDSLILDPSLASPTAFANSVHNMMALYLSMALSITGPVLTISDQSLSTALLSSLLLLENDMAEQVLLAVVGEKNVLMEELQKRSDYGSVLIEGAAIFRLTLREESNFYFAFEDNGDFIMDFQKDKSSLRRDGCEKGSLATVWAALTALDPTFAPSFDPSFDFAIDRAIDCNDYFEKIILPGEKFFLVKTIPQK